LECGHVWIRNLKHEKADAARLKAFEMWVWRRLEKVKWADKKTNAEVLNLVNEKKSLLSESGK